MESIAVIGGGITGLFIAKEASRIAKKVVLFEKGELGKETSDNSLRIIHGGFRYLQHLEVGRIFTSRNDQRAFKEEFSKMTDVLTCYMPLKKFGLKSAPLCWIAGKLYKCIAPESNSKILGFAKLPENLQKLKDTFSRGALVWNDLVLSDPKGVIEAIKNELVNRNISIQEHHEVLSIERKGSNFNISGKQFGKDFEEEFSHVVNAAGPFIKSINLKGIRNFTDVMWCKGFNIIIPNQFVDNYALALHGKDRLYFLVPRSGGTAIGTWYYPRKEEDKVDEKEVLKFLDSFNAASPFTKVRIEDVKKIESGILPAQNDGRDTLRQSKLHLDSGYLEVVSTKYTEARSLSKEAIRILL